MNRYYTVLPDMTVLVWEPEQDPRMQWSPQNITGDSWQLQNLFSGYGNNGQRITAVYVPHEIVRILSAS